MAKLQGKNKKNRLDKLLETEDPVFDTDYGSAEPSDNTEENYLKMAPCEEARNIIMGIDSYIGWMDFEKNGSKYSLINESRSIKKDDFYNTATDTNALLATAYAGLGERTKAVKIIESIENMIGFYETGLPQISIHDWRTGEEASYAMIVAYLAVGYKEKAKKLDEAMDKYPDTDAVMGGFLDQIILGELALLSQGNSKRVFESMNSDFIKKRVPDTKKRVKILLSAIDNCLLGADYAHKSLIDSFTDGLEKKFVKGTYFLGKDKDEDDYMAYTNAALAIAYMTREYRKNG